MRFPPLPLLNYEGKKEEVSSDFSKTAYVSLGGAEPLVSLSLLSSTG